MKLKDAIEVLTDHVRDCPAKPVCYNCQAHNLVIAELRKAKREKREMWKAMSVNCTYQDMYADCTAQDGHPECTISNCPLLLKRGKGKG